MEKVLIAGGSGLIGQRLVKKLTDAGHQVAILTRSPKSNDTAKSLKWDIKKSYIDPIALEYDYIINLTGAGIADKRWTKKRKAEIISSRTESAALILNTFSKRENKVKSIVNASAIGYYGDSGDKLLYESDPSTTDEFLTDVCQKWEGSALQLSSITEQLAILRIGTVLTPDGGALPEMSKTIPLGVASYLGNGRQWISWIHIDDICDIIIFLLFNKNKDVIYNAVSPEPHTNKEFTQQLKSVINRYALLVPAPALAIRALFGELAHLVLNSNRVSSCRIEAEGFTFSYPNLEAALRNLYKK